MHGKRLLVFDDVVDSFDYANKYAFIEYLKEFSEIEDVYVLLLTHNYDFFRTVTNRVEGFSRSNCSVAERDAQGRLTFDAVSTSTESLPDLEGEDGEKRCDKDSDHTDGEGDGRYTRGSQK